MAASPISSLVLAVMVVAAAVAMAPAAAADPPTITREIRRAAFQPDQSGSAVFTESFHDFSPPDLRVASYRTFVYANGDVRVDREFDRLPPPSC